MNKLLFSLLLIVSSFKINAQVYINPGVDTTDTNINAAVKFYSNYINEFKRKKLPDFTKYWSAEDCKKYKVPDQGVYGLGGDFPIYAMAEIKTIFYVKPLKNGTILLKTIGGYTDSLKRLDVLYISNNYLTKDAKQQLHFISTSNYDKKNWQQKKLRNITYFYQKSHIFNTKKADSLIINIKNLEQQWDQKPIEIAYYLANNFEEIQLLRGFSFTMGLGNQDKPTGMSNQTDNIVYCAGNGENYLHEIVHIYLNRLHPKSPLNEGLAVFYGGSMGKPLQWHTQRLKSYLNLHKEINLNKLEDFWFMDNYTNPNTAIQAILCAIVFKKEGIKGLKRLMTYESMNEVFEKEFKFDLEKLDLELRALINNQ